MLHTAAQAYNATTYSRLFFRLLARRKRESGLTFTTRAPCNIGMLPPEVINTINEEAFKEHVNWSRGQLARRFGPCGCLGNLPADVSNSICLLKYGKWRCPIAVGWEEDWSEEVVEDLSYAFSSAATHAGSSTVRPRCCSLTLRLTKSF